MTERETVKDLFPTFLLSATILSLIIASFVPAEKRITAFTVNGQDFDLTNGALCAAFFLLGVVYYLVKKKPALVRRSIKEIDFFTLLLLAGLFIVVGSITEAGVIDEISKLFVKISGGNLFVIYTILVWFSVLLSAFIDNIPYVATMLPVTAGIAASMGLPPYLLFFGLVVGSTLGGNLTPIGASANIASMGILRKEGYQVKTTEFMKISVPYALAAAFTGYVLVWLIY
jgi:Na+/H+ antiporter NhaD/arsenite permease-like protein